MSIGFSVGNTANSASTQVASQAITIDPGAGTGHTCLFVACVVPLSASAAVMSATSTGTTPVQVGATQIQSVPAPGTVNVGVWKVIAGPSDPGATVTFSSTISGFWSVAQAVYFSTLGAPVIDVSGGTIAATGAASVTCPSLTTGVAGEWAIYLTGGTYEVSGLTGSPSGSTVRELVTSSSAVVAGIYDSAASVGGAGTAIGGGTFTTGGANANNALAAFTIGIRDPGTAPATSGLLLTAFP